MQRVHIDQVPRPCSFITVADAADELGIGESLAYRMANDFLRTRGATGIPCVRMGRRLLVSRDGLLQLAAAGSATSPDA